MGKKDRVPKDEGEKKAAKSKGLACPVCGKVFPYEHRMRVHTRTHTGETPFSCSHCQKSFSQKAALMVHMRTHTGERPFSCEACDKRFARADHLNQHSRTHTGEKPYACTICSRAFATWSAISRHRAEHATRDSFACPHCNKTFSRSDNLRSHISKLHKDIPKQEMEEENKVKIEPLDVHVSEDIKDVKAEPTDLQEGHHSFGSHFLAVTEAFGVKIEQPCVDN